MMDMEELKQCKKHDTASTNNRQPHGEQTRHGVPARAAALEKHGDAIIGAGAPKDRIRIAAAASESGNKDKGQRRRYHFRSRLVEVKVE